MSVYTIVVIQDEQEFNRIFKALPGLYLVLRPDPPDFTIIAASDEYTAATEKRLEDIVGKRMFDEFPDDPDDSAADGVANLTASLHKAMKHKKPHKMAVQKYDIQLPDGSFSARYWSPLNTPVLDNSGKVTHIIHAVVDVTPTLKLERQEKDSRIKFDDQTKLLLGANQEVEAARLLQAVSDNATQGLIMMNSEQRCVFMNPAAEAITGYSFAEITRLAKPLHDIIHHMRPDGSHYPMTECPIDRALPQRNHTQGEDIFVRKDHTFYPVAFTASPILENSRPIGTVIELRDISQEKFAEEQHDHLIALNKAKDEFISLASHQLRTPATGAKQYIGMLMDGFAGDLTGEQQRLLDVAYQSNERQITIINDLLEVARIDAGKVKLHKEPADLVPLVNDILSEQASLFEGRQQTIRYETDKSKIVSIIDKPRIRMAIENLIDNASKYTPEHKEIIVRIIQYRDAGSVAIHVTDQGVGIAAEDLSKLFHKFARLENPLSRSVDGSGLGLYWADKIVGLHGGTITVESKIGVGSTFMIDLPQPV